MPSSTSRNEPRALHVDVTDDEIQISLTDGRRVLAPLVWYPRLLHASREQRQKWRLIGDGEGIHWADLDEDLSVAGVLAGIPSRESSAHVREYIHRAAGSTIQGEEKHTDARS